MSFESWRLDHYTWGWIVWIVFFAVFEAYCLWRSPGTAELTAHLRPVFQAGGGLSPIYFLAVGLWMWLGVHFLVDGLLVNKG